MDVVKNLVGGMFGTAETKKELGAVDEKKLFIGGLGRNVTSDDLNAYFSKFGEVEEAIVKTTSLGESRGFGFVKFVNASAVQKVLKVGEEHAIKGKVSEIKMSRREVAHEKDTFYQRQKVVPEVCKFWLAGECNRGDDCKFRKEKNLAEKFWNEAKKNAGTVEYETVYLAVPVDCHGNPVLPFVDMNKKLLEAAQKVLQLQLSALDGIGQQQDTEMAEPSTSMAALAPPSPEYQRDPSQSRSRSRSPVPPVPPSAPVAPAAPVAPRSPVPPSPPTKPADLADILPQMPEMPTMSQPKKQKADVAAKIQAAQANLAMAAASSARARSPAPAAEPSAPSGPHKDTPWGRVVFQAAQEAREWLADNDGDNDDDNRGSKRRRT